MIRRSSWSGRGAGLRPRRAAFFPAAAALSLFAAGCGSEPSTGPDLGPCDVTTAIEIDGVGDGSLTAQDCNGVTGRYQDHWSLAIPREMTVLIRLSSEQFDTWLELEDARGNVIAQNDDAGGTLNSALVLQLSPGEYRIVATSFAPSATGAYRLEVAEAAECAPVGTLSVGDTVQGTLTANACYWEYGTQAENWSLSIGSARDVRIALESDDFEEGVLVRDSGGSILYGQMTSGPGGRAQFDIHLEAGGYTVIVTTIMEGMTGDYELSVLDAPACTPGTAVELDVEIAGVLTDDDCTVPGRGPADSYTLTLDAETALDLVLKSVEFPPVILVRDGEGTEVVVGYEYATAGTATARAVLPAGTYEVLPTSQYGGARGAYRLTVSEASCAEPGEIRPGDTVSGTITDQDCLLDDNRFRDSWSLVLDTATTVQIDLTSGDFDAYLILRDADGAEVATDDDGGSGTDARIIRALEAGTYEVLATTWAPYQFGSYQLAVRESEAAASPSALPTSGSSKAAPPASALAQETALDGPAPWWEERIPK